MKSSAENKASDKQARDTKRNLRAGVRGISRMPPTYGIGLVDHGHGRTPAVQAKGGLTGSDIHKVAKEGTKGAGQRLPYFDTVQRAVGGAIDVSGIVAHVGVAASQACQQMGALAYTIGNHVVFGKEPDLGTTVHETIHVGQQVAGMAPKDGVGRPGDHYEQSADEAEKRVVSGQSLDGLLPAPTNTPSSQGAGGGLAVQMKPQLTEPLPSVGVRSTEDSGTTGSGKGLLESTVYTTSAFYPAEGLPDHLPMPAPLIPESPVVVREKIGALAAIEQFKSGFSTQGPGFWYAFDEITKPDPVWFFQTPYAKNTPVDIKTEYYAFRWNIVPTGHPIGSLDYKNDKTKNDKSHQESGTKVTVGGGVEAGASGGPPAGASVNGSVNANVGFESSNSNSSDSENGNNTNVGVKTTGEYQVYEAYVMGRARVWLGGPTLLNTSVGKAYYESEKAYWYLVADDYWKTIDDNKITVYNHAPR